MGTESEWAATLIIVGGALQVAGVGGVLFELSTLRNRLQRRDVTLDVEPITAESTIPNVDLDSPTVEQRIGRLESEIGSLQSALDRVRAEVRSGDKRARQTAVARIDEVERLARELAAPHPWATASAFAIILGLVVSTIGGWLAL